MDAEEFAGWGIRRLAAAMVIRAALDIRFVKKGREVVSWLQDSSEAELSFIFCCRVLGRDPRRVRAFLEQQADWLTQPEPTIIYPKPPGRSSYTATGRHPSRPSAGLLAS